MQVAVCWLYLAWRACGKGPLHGIVRYVAIAVPHAVKRRQGFYS